ncbi:MULTISPECIES: hypothetical protein [Bacillus cereus group]|uniref:hypothetical protein n=1 Tax=Bacillus cereus group TaxID=86661 RepID=UPI000B1D3E6B|nr:MULTISPECIES: hypothetical protein [Bacillus cereus group]MCM0006123.1 hypothetical protein [Bacillus paranthracis]MDX5884921.1 hypothetical protein [Bacillus cereus group sp. BfR-BA-00999]MDX6046765.1 hypothetical protein [Bacillus paranthracis]
MDIVIKELLHRLRQAEQTLEHYRRKSDPSLRQYFPVLEEEIVQYSKAIKIIQESEVK